MDMNFPHDSVSNEQKAMLDLDEIRSTIIASASARQAASETARKLQISHETKLYSNKLQSISGLKARILFFARAKSNSRDAMTHKIICGPFNPINDDNRISQNDAGFKYEDAVNLNNSNYLKSSALDNNINDDNIVDNNSNSISNRG